MKRVKLQRPPERDTPFLEVVNLDLMRAYRLSLPQISYMHDETTEYQYDALGGQ